MRDLYSGAVHHWGYLVLVVLMTGSAKAQNPTSPILMSRIDSLIRVADTRFGNGEREQALDLADQAMALAGSQAGKFSEAYAQACSGAANLLALNGEYSRAEDKLAHAIDIIQQAGFSWTGYEPGLSRLAVLREELGYYEKAANCLEDLRDYRQTDSPTPDPYPIGVLSQLVRLYRKMGRFDQADSLFSVARLWIASEKVSPDLDFARMLLTMADLYREIENYPQAESSYQQAVQILRELDLRNTAEYISTLTGLAGVYLDLDQSVKAEPYLDEARKLTGKGWFVKRPDYGPVLTGLAELYRRQGKTSAVETLYQVALDRLERDAQTKTPDYAQLTDDLATLYQEQGRLTEAEEQFDLSRQTWASLRGTHVPGYPRTLMNLADLYRVAGRIPEARTLFEKSLQIWETTLGREYPLYIVNLLDLARIAWTQGDWTQADSLYAEASVIGRRRMSNAVQYMSEREMKGYLQKYEDTQDEIISYVLDSAVQVKRQAIQACYDNAMFYKGFLLNAAQQKRSRALADTLSRPLYLEISALRRMIGQEYARPKSERVQLAGLEERVDSLEDCLSGRLMDEDCRYEPHAWTDIPLPPGHAAIEFMKYRPFVGGRFQETARYAAFFLIAGKPLPVAVDLFDEKVLGFLSEPWGQRDELYVKFIYTSDTRGFIVSGPPRPTLYELIWQKLEARGMRDVSTVHFASAGVLHRINLGAIAVSRDTLLLDRYRMIQMASTRQMVNRANIEEEEDAKDPANRPRELVIFGGIRYDAPDGQPSSSRGHTPATPVWNYLVGTEGEVRDLDSLLARVEIPCVNITGFQATEGQFKALGEFDTVPSPSAMHIGTHGFFLEDPDPETPSHLPARNPMFSEEDQPMFRSGLIFAGANAHWLGTPLRAGEAEDGILTAYEISQLDLNSTRLVILSACETGLGAIRGNEGVYGLQRAFSIAGTHQMIMSLWQISDEKTRLFMSTFYTHWLQDGQTVRDAFRHTQQEMRSRFIDHYDWAGFILLEN